MPKTRNGQHAPKIAVREKRGAAFESEFSTLRARLRKRSIRKLHNVVRLSTVRNCIVTETGLDQCVCGSMPKSKTNIAPANTMPPTTKVQRGGWLALNDSLSRAGVNPFSCAHFVAESPSRNIFRQTRIPAHPSPRVNAASRS